MPAVFPFPGEGWEGVTRQQEDALIERWWRHHRPDDEWDASFPLAGLQRFAEFAVLLCDAFASR